MYRSLNLNGTARPANIVGRTGNIISLNSLPTRKDGAPPPVRVPSNFARVPSKFAPRPGGGAGPRLANRPSGGNFKPRTGGGGFARRPGGAGGKRDAKRKPRKEKEKNETAPIELNDATKAYIREQEMGVEVTYKPSFTPKSLVGWGPAVATNTATGLHEIAVRNIRLMGGGRPHSEGEQTFEGIDMQRWLKGGKPIYFSSMQQKKGMLKTLQGSKKGPTPLVETKAFDVLMQRLKNDHGNDYGAFVKAFNARFDPAAMRQQLDAQQADKARRLFTRHSATVKEAVAKYALKGDHPTVQYAEDNYGKVAVYQARGSTYRPADGAKFDAKMKTLVAP